MLRVGCVGFPVARDRYWGELRFFEADTGKAMPRPETLAGWKADMPSGAECAVQAFRLATHGPEDRGFPAAGKKLPANRQALCGAFRDTLEVHEAWMATKSAAEALGARIVVFETPITFQPGPDRTRDLYRFFKKAARGNLAFVWQPRSVAWGALADKVCAELGLIRGFDPLKEPAPRKGAFAYMRPSLPPTGSLGVDNLATILGVSDDAPAAYLALGHRNAFRDAERVLAQQRVRR